MSLPIIDIVRSTCTEMPSIFFISAAMLEAKGLVAICVANISCQPARSVPMSFVTHITWVMDPPIGIVMVSVYLVAFQSLTFCVSVEGVTVTFVFAAICSMWGAASGGMYFFMSKGRSIVETVLAAVSRMYIFFRSARTIVTLVPSSTRM